MLLEVMSARWLSTDSQPKLINRANCLASALAALAIYLDQPLCPPLFFIAELPVLLYHHSSGFITTTDKLWDVIHISQQLVPGCLHRRGCCQVDLHYMLS